MPAKWKIKEVEELTNMLRDSPVIGVASISGLPSKQFQEIRAKLKGSVNIKVAKITLLKRAFEANKKVVKGITDLEPMMQGPTAIITTTENPFKLQKILSESKTPSYAKEGEVAPYDIVIPAGDTPFKPGPIIGELQEVGIKAKIQGPSITVVEDSLVVKEGEEINKKVASVLQRMEVKPMYVGIDLRAALEHGVVYDSKILTIDSEETKKTLATAYSNALNLAFNAGIMNKTTVEIFLADASQKALNLAVNAGIINKDTIEVLLSKGRLQAQVLNSIVTGEPMPEAASNVEATTSETDKGNAPEDKPKESEADKEKAAEDAAAGLGALFG